MYAYTTVPGGACIATNSASVGRCYSYHGSSYHGYSYHGSSYHDFTCQGTTSLQLLTATILHALRTSPSKISSRSRSTTSSR